MARYRYKSYKRRPSRRRRRLYYGLALAAIIVVFLFIRSGSKKRIKESHAGEELPPSQNQEAFDPAASLFETPRKPEPLPELLPLPQEGGQNAEAVAFISQAEQDINAGRIVEGRDKLNEALRTPLTASQQVTIKKWLSALAEKWLFSRDYYPGDTLCSTYKVRPGEILSDIAKRHKIPYQAMLEINNISRPEALRAGGTIKVVNGPFNAIVYRSAFVMDLYLQSTYVRSFRVGLGSPDSPTPTGLWRVKQDGKLVKPSWTDPDTGRLYEGSDRDYPLGSRWIGLEGMQGNAKGRTGFAIHGTKKPEEIGTASSKGCIRLHNGDAILMYNLLTPVYSELRVVD
jgi:hypothetical protein